MKSPLWLLASLSLLAPWAYAGGIRIVDQPALGPFTSLQAAIDAADEGSLLLVEAGSYGNATIAGKSLSIVAMPTAGSKGAGRITVQDLTSAQAVLISGLFLKSTATPGVVLASNAGHVRIQGCTIVGGKFSSASGPAGHPGLKASACASVVLSNCTLSGGSVGFNSGYPGTPGGPGLESVDSALAIFDSTLSGGTGSEEGYPSGGTGGDGCRVVGWGLFASGSAFKGGSGGGGDYLGCPDGGTGGNALNVTNCQAQLLDVALQPGTGGWTLCGSIGNSGQALVNNGALVTQLPGTVRRLSGVALASDASSVDLALEGQTGDRLFALVGIKPAFAFANGLGVWAMQRPVHLPYAPAGTVGASGVLNVQHPTKLLQQNQLHGLTILQGLVLDSSGALHLTNPMHLPLFNRDGGTDCNGNSINDFVDLLELPGQDCNTNIALDACDIAFGGAQDCNANGVPDACDIATGAEHDCNSNGVPDACDIAFGAAQDCNGNANPDACDIASGSSYDVNGNNIPDECESITPQVLWVDAAAPSGGNGTPAAPFQTISDGLAAAFHGDTVMIRDGIYAGPSNRNLDPKGKAITVRSEHGPAACVIDCQGASRAFRFASGEGPDTRLIGLTIRNGDAQGSPTDNHQGGGIFVYDSSPVLEDCAIEHCSGRLGGGIYASSTALQVRGCSIRNCVAPTISVYEGQGGGAYVSWIVSGPLRATFVDTKISGCQADVGAGLSFGSYAPDADPQLVLSHCRLIGNAASSFGGGLAASHYSSGGGRLLVLDNCLVAGNSAPHGAGIGAYATSYGSSTPGWTLVNCTLADNAATIDGGALHLGGSSSFAMPPVEILNCVSWGNSAPAGPMLYDQQGQASVSVYSSDVQAGPAGFLLGAGSTLAYDSSNIDLDPAFADADGPDNDPATVFDNDYRLSPTSPCIDAANNGLVAQDWADIDGDGNLGEPAPLDLELLPRFVDILGVPDTGLGTPPLVDMGAFERQP